MGPIDAESGDSKPMMVATSPSEASSLGLAATAPGEDIVPAVDATDGSPLLLQSAQQSGPAPVLPSAPPLAVGTASSGAHQPVTSGYSSAYVNSRSGNVLIGGKRREQQSDNSRLISLPGLSPS